MGISNSNIISAAKWSTITEVLSRLIAPLTNIILARILTPESFGIIATLTLIITFFDLFVESGFHNYLIQNKFNSIIDLDNAANVAFWCNLVLSTMFFIAIILFDSKITALLGLDGLERLLIFASIQLIINAFISVPSALLKRNLDFKSIFFVRIFSVFIPICVTIPLALLHLDYWSVIIGSICMSLCTAILMNIRAKWKPKKSFNLDALKNMYSFSYWTQLESIVIWLTIWIDTFIIALYLNNYQLGIYKTSMSLVNNIMAIVASSVLPVLFSSLSKLQDNFSEFKNVLFKFQRTVSFFVVPLGVALYVYQDFVSSILLGKQWSGSAQIIGLWGLSSAVVISLGYFNSEVYRAMGKPKLSVFSQCLHLIILIPAMIISGEHGFLALLYIRVIVRIIGTAIGLFFLQYFFNIKIIEILKNVLPSYIGSILTGLLGVLLLELNDSRWLNIVFIFICIIVYVSLMFFNSHSRPEVISLKKLLFKFKRKKHSEVLK